VRRQSIAVAALLGATSLAWILFARQKPTPASWPEGNATLTPPSASFPSDFGKRRVFLDPGHGAEDNTGNRSSLCEDEQDFTMALAVDLVPRLESSGHFEVMLSRRPGELVAYRDRVHAAENWRADVFISLHSDVRGSAEPDHECPTSHRAPGFSVLWSDDGSPLLNDDRLALARNAADSLAALGITAYGGDAYAGLYDGDTSPGVFVDRHEPGKRIFVLHKPRMPSIIIETHNAWDDREAERWREPTTRTAFADALSHALAGFLAPRPSRKREAEPTPLR
jgi:N-acetylmuramoyl-L-alanine amidase